MIHWKKLLNIAYEVLNEANIPLTEWTFGGGTALSYFYNHRESKDIDIFFHSAQILTYVSPRLNSKAEKVSENYTEQSNFIKLYIQNQEIDFIVAPNLTGISPKLVKIENMELYIDDPVEIIAKKLFYRPESLKVRDIIDTVVVYTNNENLTKILKEKKITIKSSLIKKRLEIIKSSPDLQKVLKNLNLKITDFSFEEYINIFERFIGEVENG
ncbi:MAG: nucleotidyl transferase AbiEii/AbiGii toxin family protein [Sulfurihydrogenibium sp.]|uniref:nucleotidyl transferase AbiEii/AbiGii toxin family protein n=1 Tax=Sulfurihydrogenibium sp. TaxID=2053621 RepID=UPI003D0B46A2